MNFIYEDESGRSDRYVALRRLGQGSFGEVRMGADTFTGKSVALNYLKRRETFLEQCSESLRV
jgi:serine/threonine protein kinase